ncbi:MAG: sialidase family protein [Pirellulales bacterium]
MPALPCALPLTRDRLWTTLLIAAGTLAVPFASLAVGDEPDRFAGFPAIHQHRPGERTLKVITSDAVTGLLRPQWTRAMTDLGAWPVMVRFQGDLLLTFYHGDGHRGKQLEGSGLLATLRSSDDGRSWQPVTALEGESVPEYVAVGETLFAYQFNEQDRQTRVHTSRDGSNWSAGQPAYQAPFYLWGVMHDPRTKTFWAPPHAIPHKGSSPERRIDLIKSADGLNWEKVSTVAPFNNASESTLRFEPDGTMVILIRRKYGKTCSVAVARPPYTDWDITDREGIAEGEHYFELGGQTFLATRSNYSGDNPEVLANPKVFDGRRSYAAIYRFTADRQFQPWAVVDSLGDCSYPFLIETADEILCAYYSQHEDGVCKVFLAGFDKRQFLAK